MIIWVYTAPKPGKTATKGTSGRLCCVIWQIAMMMEVVSTSETSLKFY
jgi:hypothetical protein